MNIDKLVKLFEELGCDSFYAKELAENDNSKQQIYLGGSFQSVNQLPRGPIYTDDTGPRMSPTYKADLNLFWLNEGYKPEPALMSKLIWYPKYPEVRLSGFLAGCKAAPSEFMKADNRLIGRVLFFGADNKHLKVYCYLGLPGSDISKEFLTTEWIRTDGVLFNLLLRGKKDTKSELITKLLEIHQLGPVGGCKMTNNKIIVPYKARNAGGLTLEAMLGVQHNSKAEADYLGWEIKHFSTTDFSKTRSRTITLFTSEPDLGLYNQDFGQFMKTYSRVKTGCIRHDFTGKHVAKLKCQSTGLKMIIEGFNFEKNEINEVNGKVLLLDDKDIVAAGWSFSRLLDHWERKHAKACYVPGVFYKKPNMYAFGNNIILGIETSFLHFITALNYGIVYYDPGNRVNISNDRLSLEKRRNQFRFSSSFLGGLYRSIEEINLLEELTGL